MRAQHFSSGSIPQFYLEHVDWIYEILYNCLLQSESTIIIDIRIFVTSTKASLMGVPDANYSKSSQGVEENSSNEKSAESDEKTVPEISNGTNGKNFQISIDNGRPNIQDILFDEISSSIADDIGVGGEFSPFVDFILSLQRFVSLWPPVAI